MHAPGNASFISSHRFVVMPEYLTTMALSKSALQTLSMVAVILFSPLKRYMLLAVISAFALVGKPSKFIRDSRGFLKKFTKTSKKLVGLKLTSSLLNIMDVCLELN